MTGTRDLELDGLDGVPYAWASVDGPPMIALVFRVGVADEQISDRGLTHLCEHLALRAAQNDRVMVNGLVDVTRTVLYASGDETALWRFATDVTDALQRLGEMDVEREARILAVESSGRPAPLIAEHHRYRYGSTGFGTAAFPEYALRNVRSTHVVRWACEHFHRGNLAIWGTMPPRPDLRLDMPSGERRHAPEALVSRTTRPSIFRLDVSAVSASLVVERSIESAAAIVLAQRRIEQALRLQHGLSYSVHANYERSTASHAHATLIADCRAEDARRCFDEFRSALLSMGTVPPDTSDVEWLREGQRLQVGTRESVVGLLDGAASALLQGGPVVTGAALTEAYRVLQAERCAAIVDQAFATAIWQAPTATPQAPGLVDLDDRPARTVSGRTTTLVNVLSPADASSRLTYGTTGISVSTPSWRATVPFSEVSAVVRWGDGTRICIAEGGDAVTVAPSVWIEGDEVVATIDANVPTDRRITQGFRYGPPTVPFGLGGRWLRSALTWAPWSGLLALVGGVVLLASARLWGAFALLAAACLLWASWRATRVTTPCIYDDAAHRAMLPDFPTRLGSEAGANWGAGFLAWAARSGHLSAGLEMSEPDLVREMRSGVVHGNEALLRLGGLLSSDMFTAQANAFAHDFVLISANEPLRWPLAGYASILDDIRYELGAGLFLSLDYPSVEDEVVRRVERAFARWRRIRPLVRIRRMLVLSRTSPDRGFGARWVRRLSSILWEHGRASV